MQPKDDSSYNEMGKISDDAVQKTENEDDQNSNEGSKSEGADEKKVSELQEEIVSRENLKEIIQRFGII